MLRHGEFASGRAHEEQGIAVYDSQKHRPHAFLYVLYGHDPGVVCLSDLGLTIWNLGYPDQALKRGHDALTLAQERSHPLSLAFALSLTSMTCQLCHRVQAVQERAEAAITLSTEHGFRFWLVAGTIMRGWALAEQRQIETGIVQMRQGLAAYQTAGAGIMRPYFLVLLAEAYRKLGRAKEGLTILTEALAAAVQKDGDRFYEAEIYRLKGELMLMQAVPDAKQAEACFHQAIDVARRQSAKSLELRAVMSLSRLWQKQGKKEKAREMLSEIYGWFTEGFDTKDLKEAKALLEELS